MSRFHQLASPGCSELLAKIAMANRVVNVSDLVEDRDVDTYDNLQRLVSCGSIWIEDETVMLTSSGRLQSLLVGALNGVGLAELSRELSNKYSASKYQLIESDMSKEFLRRLHARPGFKTMFICSPWLSFDEEAQALIRSIVYRDAGALIYAITRRKQDQRGIEFLKSIGATMYFREQLHTKLYIREPGPSGGLSMAILGSQNLTRSKYDELGIAVINDGVINAKLISYFRQLASKEAA